MAQAAPHGNGGHGGRRHQGVFPALVTVAQRLQRRWHLAAAQGKAFQPERWLAEGGEANNRRAAMPFGAGLRTCPGRYLALLEIKIAMAMLLGSFDIAGIDTPDGGEAQELMGFVMSPIGLTMRLARPQ